MALSTSRKEMKPGSHPRIAR
ncbi:uncharacterized protein G2W53_037586 [Senna tora]|uniref:Uncharacterized protein n=1 Tax=Senna tora TaxID=362788 RepID=A0A834SMX3_9FABA|nr:uncharacterized protein G2W53_037586 [Senna tora]